MNPPAFIATRGVVQDLTTALEQIQALFTAVIDLSYDGEIADSALFCQQIVRLSEIGQDIASRHAAALMDPQDRPPSDAVSASDDGFKAAQQWFCDLADRYEDNRAGTVFKSPITLDLDRFYDPLTTADQRKFVEALGTLVLEHLEGTTPVPEVWDPEQEIAWMATAHLHEADAARALEGGAQ